MYEIEGCYHVSHCVADLDAADTFYRDVLGAHLVEKNYVESALRDASFWVIADYVWEVVCPAHQPGAGDAPLGRFLRRYGPRLHSFSWWVDDPAECVAVLGHAGVRAVDVAGTPVDAATTGSDAAIFTHPADTHGMLEFAGPDCTPELRMPVEGAPGLSYWRQHALGIQRVSHLTVVVADMERAVSVFTAATGARELRRSTTDGHYSSAFLALGPTRVELRRPASAESAAGRFLASNGEGSYSVAFAVADLDRARRFLTSAGCRPVQVSGDTLALDPATSLRVPYEFTIADMRDVV
jgi:catechol 2,3-dioxygenase-like lactoylglutathione lyase family enzyme